MNNLLIWWDSVRGVGTTQNGRRQESLGGSLKKAWIRFGFGPRIRRNFYSALANQIGAGVKIQPAMATRYRIYSEDGRKPNVPAAYVANDIVSKIGVDGKGLADAMRPWVSPSEASVVAAGEAAGGDALAGIFRRLVETSKRRSALIGAAWKPVSYGVLMLLIDIGMLIGFVIFALPQLTAMAPRSSMHGGEATFVDVLTFFRDYGAGLAAVVSGLALFVGATIGRFTRTSRIGRILEHLPPWSVYRVYQNAMFLENIANLLASETAQIEALTVMAKGNSAWVQIRLIDIRERLRRKGSNFGTALAETPYGFPDKETVYFMADAQNTPDFAEAIETFANSEFDQQVERVGRVAKVANFFLLLMTALWFLLVIYGVVGMATGGFGQINN